MQTECAEYRNAVEPLAIEPDSLVVPVSAPPPALLGAGAGAVAAAEAGIEKDEPTAAEEPVAAAAE